MCINPFCKKCKGKENDKPKPKEKRDKRKSLGGAKYETIDDNCITRYQLSINKQLYGEVIA